MNNIKNILVEEFKLKPFQVENTLKLIEENNTIPFIARYRKESTGGLDDETLRNLNERLTYLISLHEKKADVCRLINEQGKLTEELKHSIEIAKTLQEVEDLYRPYKQKRKTRASVAKENGLEPLSKILTQQKKLDTSIENIAQTYLNDNVPTIEQAIEGAKDIVAEIISDNAEYRKLIRAYYFDKGVLISKGKTEEDSVYKMYYDFKQAVKSIPSHRILAINRGESENFLSVKIDILKEACLKFIISDFIINKNATGINYLFEAIDDSFDRLISPSIEREIRGQVTVEAQESAIKVFATNLKNLVMQPPVRGRVVLGLDPAYRTGCKIAVVDDTGNPLETTVIYPTPPQSKIKESEKIIETLINKHGVTLIAIGNGTASRESEKFISEFISNSKKKLHYVIVSEAGASVYSASKLATIEFPEYDVAIRSAISIARRLQDPLSELVKIDPKSIGVGQYQHDINQKKLDEALRGTVESCVNSVGVDLNTASPSLLSYIAGINSSIAQNIVEYRKELGKFEKRSQLKKVNKLGKKSFEQCAGFLRIPSSNEYLDRTSVHPESYEVAKLLLKKLNYQEKDIGSVKLKNLKKEIDEIGIINLSKEMGIGHLTLRDIVDELLKPGRDPRDELPLPILMSDVLEIEDLKEGMVLKGTVRNVADFGAFVDIGIHQDGLVHISEITDKFIKSPLDVLSVGDIVTVKILNIDIGKKRISLSMKGV